ncbi:hypothetical protein FB45DRAFT_944148 [Roridomyces roridus]|uniref:Uncharacterized protein n=1 Tax=Roridomyces roridus TaxID=1738132 RepID=A0AAD7FB86_9AGAR|nr:hypothetical protein FB45DRAFT_944148 [Roridomyces roridus]
MSSRPTNEEIASRTTTFALALFQQHTRGSRRLASPIDLAQVADDFGSGWPTSAIHSHAAQLWTWNGHILFEAAVTKTIRDRYGGFAASPSMASRLIVDSMSDTPATTFYALCCGREKPQIPFDMHNTFYAAIHHLSLRHSIPAVHAWVKDNISDLIFETLAYVLPLMDDVRPAPGVPYPFVEMSEYWRALKALEDGEIVDRPGRGRRSPDRQIAPLPRRWDKS